MVVMVNVPAVPTMNVTLFALVITGAWFTVSVKLCLRRRADAVGRGDRQRIRAAGTAAGVPASVRGAVAVVGEGTPAGSVPVLGDGRRRRTAGGGHVKCRGYRPRTSRGRAGEGGGRVHVQREGLHRG